MASGLFTRRDFSANAVALLAGLGISRTAFATSSNLGSPVFADNDDVSHNAESIHQELVFNAARKRVYGALTAKSAVRSSVSPDTSSAGILNLYRMSASYRPGAWSRGSRESIPWRSSIWRIRVGKQN